MSAGPELVFRCRRSGRCCRLPEGLAFLEPGEAEALGAHLGLEPEVFAARYVRHVTHPPTGELRPALRDRADGACVLLDGDRTCSAYEARPRQCRDFPLWASVLDDPAGLARARRTCPGIEEVPTGEAVAAAEAAWSALSAGLPGGAEAGAACAFDLGVEPGPQASGFEAAHLVRGLAEADDPGACPAHRAGACLSPERRPLVCRARLASHGEAEGPTDEGGGGLAEAAAALDRLTRDLAWPRAHGPLGQLAAGFEPSGASRGLPLRLRFGGPDDR